MKNFIFFLFLISFTFSHSQRLDLGFEYLIPVTSGSIVSTQYNYLNDDPVSFNFAKVKNKIQYYPQFNLGLNFNLELSFRMLSFKLIYFPGIFVNRTFKVYYPLLQNGETKYTASINQFGFQIQPLIKYSFKTMNKHKIALLSGAFYFRQYQGTPYEDESLFFQSHIIPGDIFKYLLWDDNPYLYGISFGIEHSFLNNKRKSRKHSLIVNLIMNPIGFNGFNQLLINYQVSFASLKLYNSLKRNKIYLE